MEQDILGINYKPRRPLGRSILEKGLLSLFLIGIVAAPALTALRTYNSTKNRYKVKYISPTEKEQILETTSPSGAIETFYKTKEGIYLNEKDFGKYLENLMERIDENIEKLDELEKGKEIKPISSRNVI